MKIWIDDERQAPPGYVHKHSVNAAQAYIRYCEKKQDHRPEFRIELIDIDHDAGNYAQLGGDYIRLLDWMEGTGRNYPIKIHSMNPVGVENMRRVIRRNGWTEVR